MAKQVIIAAMEEVFGEYILNISKENLKIAVLRGKIVLENVQMDGELIGSHFMGAFGLTGFGVLSCCAKSIHIRVPWKNIEKEPTKFEVRGVHLVCVPLTPSTANQLYGAGTRLDPRCSLRTRAKRLLLARLERNFWNGQIPNEGPPMKRITRAVREVERDLRRSRNHIMNLRTPSHRRNKSNGSTNTASSRLTPTDDEIEIEEALDNLIFGLNDGEHGGLSESSREEKNSNIDDRFSADDLPEIPRDWKVKLREKVLRNMEASITEVHVRLEISEGGVNFLSRLAGDESSNNLRMFLSHEDKAIDERAFCVGFTLDRFIMRTASDKWEVGSHDKRNAVDGSAMSSVKGQLGPNPYVVKNNKIGFFTGFSIYWDNKPPFLLAETDALQGNYQKLSPDQLIHKIAGVMDALYHSQNPGKDARKSLGRRASSDNESSHQLSHDFVCHSLDAEIRVRQSDRQVPGPLSCSADVLPFEFTFNLRPHQYLQYQRLKMAIKCQQRFDTMFRRRPIDRPKENARTWWKYAIGCVISRPNSRSWDDVLIIVRSRRRYMELVLKKHKIPVEGNGFHGSLSDEESAELLELEDLLPTEALETFHLLALRQAYKLQRMGDGHVGGANNEEQVASSSRQRGLSNPFRMLGGGGRERTRSTRAIVSSPGHSSITETSALHLSSLSPRRSIPNATPSTTPNEISFTDEASRRNSLSILEAVTLRLGKKVHFILWKIHDATINLVLLGTRGDNPLAHVVLRSSGTVRSFGKAKRDFFFDISQIDAFHREERVMFLSSPQDGSLSEFGASDSERSFDENATVESTLSLEDSVVGAPDLATSSRFLALPPYGIVSRIAGGKDLAKITLSISAHPATLVWTTALFDSLSEFLSVQSNDEHDNLAQIIRNAATPLARKAQLALLSPSTMAVHLNVSAPKIWVPISAQNSAGALFIDAGTIKISCLKDEGETDMHWDMQSRDIQVNFIRGRNMWFPNDNWFISHLIEKSNRSETSIIRPVHVSIEARNRVVDESDAYVLRDGRDFLLGVIRDIDVVVSPVSLNLVDAEVIARVFGKWYGRIVNQSRRRSSSIITAHDIDVSIEDNKPLFSHGITPRVLTIYISTMEIALEGHSKSLSGAVDDNASQDSFHEVAPMKRTYVFEVNDIAILQTMKDDVKRTLFSIVDASIIRLREGCLYSPMKGNLEVSEAQYAILVRASELRKGTRSSSDIVRVSLMHDGHSHLDEVEIDIDSIILRVTPTTLKDCAKAIHRFAEFAQLVTREMERKVHEQGRKARRLEHNGSSYAENIIMQDRPLTPSVCGTYVGTDITHVPERKFVADSSILFKVTIHDSTLLAGLPTTALENKPLQRNRGLTFAVVQVLSNALIMFQSVENPDSSGTKTIHVSVDNVSSLVTTDFSRVSPNDAQPMVGPAGAEFRVVYSTENFGYVVAQDLSVDCEALKVCMTPNDLSIFLSICKKMFQRLRAFGWEDSDITSEYQLSPRRLRPLSSIIRYQKSGKGISTQARGEVQAFCFTLLHSYKSFVGAPQFLEFNMQNVKGKLQGCMLALSGDCSTTFSVNLFNADVGEWEYVIEPFPVVLTLEKMPNELVLHFSSERFIHMNLTGILLKDFAEMKFDFLRDRRPRCGGTMNGESLLNSQALSTIGLRRATETCSVRVHNRTGIDVCITSDPSIVNPTIVVVLNGDAASVGEGQEVDSMKLSFLLTDQAVRLVGEREPVNSIPVKNSEERGIIYLLRPLASCESLSLGRTNLLRSIEGEIVPETIQPIDPNSELFVYNNAEPVVEWCMHNERLRSSIADVYSIEKGRDLLSSIVWSPEDEATSDFASKAGSPEAATGEVSRTSTGHDTLRKATNAPLKSSYWLKPYLKDDSPEWTDMTCTLRMARERVMLPDENWIWVNDWTIDLSGKMGDVTDADGWEYEADFETFTRKRRGYQRGDSCRRCRWTRTRIVKPSRLDDPLRQLKFVWESAKDDNGNYSILIRSHVRVQNNAPSSISFFVFSPSWDQEVFIGTANPGEDICVPVHLASAVYMRLARRVGKSELPKVRDCLVSERFLILPSSYTASNFIRISMDLQDVTHTTEHFVVEIRCRHGIVDVNIEPVLRVINLLPCELACQFGEVLTTGDARAADGRRVIESRSNKKIAQCESTTIASGKEGACTAINPWRKPHVSMRVPGYQWSPWQRITNRKGNSHTWRPTDEDEDLLVNIKGDADLADEFQTVVRFQRTGQGVDPLSIILSVECGHCPTLRVYSQYWIVDKTGFGCHFAEGFSDIIGSNPDSETSRRSYLTPYEAKEQCIKRDLTLQGHQWSIGMSGLSMFFTRKEKLILAIASGDRDRRQTKRSLNTISNWTSPLDVSNVFPKTVISVDEKNGPRRFELAVCVTVCTGIFSRTKLVTLLPRYQMVNLLHRELIIAQDGCLDAVTRIPSRSAVPFHWEKGVLVPMVRIGVSSVKEKNSSVYSCWTNGRFRIDRVGITSIRLPTDSADSKIPLVVQVEVRLASKEQTSAVVVVVWAASPNSNPLYVLRNRTPYTILCRQPLRYGQEISTPESNEGGILSLTHCGRQSMSNSCGTNEVGPIVSTLLGFNRVDEFIWILKSDDVVCFGFDDPEKQHLIEWTYTTNGQTLFDDNTNTAKLEVDAMGSSSSLVLSGHRRLCCQIGAEHSTKVIEFKDATISVHPLSSDQVKLWGYGIQSRVESGNSKGRLMDELNEDEEDPAFSLRIDLPGCHFSVVDNVDSSNFGREILLASLLKILFTFSQTREGYHEFEFKLNSLQVDNHVNRSIHPVLIFCPRLNESEPLLHMSAVRRLQLYNNTYVFRYAAIRLLELDVYLDRRTAECIARFIEPLTDRTDLEFDIDHTDWVSNLTSSMGRQFTQPDRDEPREIEKLIHTANSGRIYFEQLHLHPVRLSLTFTQDWMELKSVVDSMMLFQFIRGMASIAGAPITFTSFMVGHVFEAPQALVRVVSTHYSSQLTKQIFGILGSLVILGAPADFISNVGTGVKDFFYEPIQGAVHGPRQFIEGLEAGTESLARGLFVGIVRGTANVTDAVNSNLAGLTTDEEFIDERKAHQRMLTDAMSRGALNRTFGESLALASASIARGLKSGALGVLEQPTLYASKYGPVGFVKGVGKAIVGVVIKPVVGLGDAAVLVMNHMSDATSKTQIRPRIPKRLRRALPCRSTEMPNCVRLESYDDRAAKAQKIVTGGESVDDVYLGHINIPSHLIIASEQCLWAIEKRSRDPWCVSWEEMSHFGIGEGGVPVVVFSQTGLKTYTFNVETEEEGVMLYELLAIQKKKMGNSSDLNNATINTISESLGRHHIPGVKSPQVNHVFGSCNLTHRRISKSITDEIDIVEKCFTRVRSMSSDTSTFLKTLDQEAWGLVSAWGQVFSGLSSRRCIVATVINGTGGILQIKSTKLVEGGSPCYSIPTQEFDQEQGILHPGGVIIFFGWGVVPSLLQAGRVFMHIEMSAMIGELSDRKGRETYAEAMPGYQISFLEKSYDESGWWAKYCLLARARK